MNLAVVIGPFIALNQVGKVGFHSLFLLFSIIVSIGAAFTMLIRQPEPENGGSVIFRFTFSHLFEKGALKRQQLESLSPSVTRQSFHLFQSMPIP